MNVVDRRPYTSPFAQTDYSQSQPHQPYEGSLNLLLNDLERGAAPVLHPSRVVRALIMHKIARQQKAGLTRLMRQAISLGLDFYSGLTDPTSGVRDFRQSVHDANLDEIMSARLLLPLGKTAWRAANPELSRSSAQRLIEETDGDDILFIALAGGGVAAGMDVYLDYNYNSRHANSEFYVCRFSNSKRADKRPLLTFDEADYLKAQGASRRVVVFDENRTTGQTLSSACNYFQSEVFAGRSVIPLTNLDER